LLTTLRHRLGPHSRHHHHPCRHSPYHRRPSLAVVVLLLAADCIFLADPAADCEEVEEVVREAVDRAVVAAVSGAAVGELVSARCIHVCGGRFATNRGRRLRRRRCGDGRGC